MLSNSVLSKFLFSFILCISAQAHESGHGQVILGEGPHGGKLTPVILAKESELGSKATTQAVLEWVKNGDMIKIYLFDKTQTQSVEVTGPAEIKWILLGEKLAKPQVIKAIFAKNQSALSQDFATDVLGKTTKVEVILPNLTGKSEKIVAAFDL